MAVKAAILNYLAEDPHAKIIVYTQWNPMVRILEKMCKTEDWTSRSYTGKMSVEAKDRAVHEFSNLPDINILIAGLKCGGLGLNLTAATKVLLIDPWWNKAIEQQAFCRIFRIGQQHPTRLVRFVCRNTIDEGESYPASTSLAMSRYANLSANTSSHDASQGEEASKFHLHLCLYPIANSPIGRDR